MKDIRSQPFTLPIILVIVLMYALSGLILAWQAGPWTTVRHVIINGLIALAWLWSARAILGNETVPALPPIRNSAAELTYGLVILILAVFFAAIWYTGSPWLPQWSVPALMIGGALALFLGQRYPLSALGLTLPSQRGWLVLTVIIVVNLAAGALFQVVPRDARPLDSAGDLAQQITGVGPAVLLLLGLLVRAALPEELLLRVTLQPRLARFVGPGWAILLQAVLFSAAHLPQHLLRNQEPLLLTIGYLLSLENGLIAGYLWYRTRNLPLLLLAHVFAFSRFGI